MRIRERHPSQIGMDVKKQRTAQNTRDGQADKLPLAAAGQYPAHGTEENEHELRGQKQTHGAVLQSVPQDIQAAVQEKLYHGNPPLFRLSASGLRRPACSGRRAALTSPWA